MPSFAMGSWLQKWRFCRNPSPPKGWRSKFAKCSTARPEAEPASPLDESRLVVWNSWSGKRDLNPRPSPWQGDALPLSYSRPDRRRSGIIRASREKRQGAVTVREALPGNRPDGHAWRRAIGWRTAGLTQGDRETGPVGVPAAPVPDGNLLHIGSTLLRPQPQEP